MSRCLAFSSRGGGGGGSLTCWYMITYDMWTGEIYDVDLLYCEVGG